MNWAGNASGTNAPLSVSMDRPKSIQAVFGTTVNTTIAGQGTVVLSPLQSLYPYGFEFSLSGEIGRMYVIQASTNLVDWTDLSRSTNITATSVYFDPTSTGSLLRFYRALTP